MTDERCPGCYQNWKGDWWCDNCDRWPCICVEEAETPAEPEDTV